MKKRELIRRAIADKFNDLPEFSAAILPGYTTPIMIKRGESGYFPLQGANVDDFNKRRNVTPAQAQAMLIGSMFGWDAPGSDPLNHADLNAPAPAAQRLADIPDVLGTTNFD